MKIRRVLSIITALLITLMALPMAGAQAASQYAIAVDLTNQIATVYTADGGEIVRQMITSTGAKGMSTPTGTYSMPKQSRKYERSKWYYFADGSKAHYASRIWGPFLFHSYLYTRTDEAYVDKETVALMGVPASHGCVRLYPENAQWIAENCPAGTKVKVYYSEQRQDHLHYLLRQKTFSIDDGVPYSDFIGAAAHDGELGYGSEGEQVRALQNRMAGLGLYTGEISGVYDDETFETISTLQTILGLTVNGKVNLGLWELLFSDEAPTCDLSSVALGSSGPMVKYIQALLKKAALYKGEINGNFDAMTDVAVRAYQSYLEEEETGVLSAKQMESLQALIGDLETRFPTGYALTLQTKQREMAKIATRSDVRLNVREKPDKDSRSLGQLKSGTDVRVLDAENGWTKISYNGNDGYLLSEYIDTYTGSVQVYDYAAADDPALVAFDPFEYEYENLLTGTENNVMNFYQKQSKKSGIAFALLKESSIELDSYDGDWAKATCGGVEGYIQVSKLKISTEKRLSTAVSGEAEDMKARNMSASDVTVYANVSTSSEPIGLLAAGKEAEVLKMGDSWSQIAFADGFGYIENSSVQIGAVSKEMKSYVASVSHLLSKEGSIDGAQALRGSVGMAAQIAGEESVPDVEGEIVDADALSAPEIAPEEEQPVDTSAARAAFDAADAEGEAFDFD